MGTTCELKHLAGAVALLAMCFFCCVSSALAEEVALPGVWQLRIDAGGEIYSGKLRIVERDGTLGGTYESDEGRRTRLSAVTESATANGRLVRIETRTQRFSVPVTAIFIADLSGGRMHGEVDFSSGANSRSYDFTATAMHASSLSSKESESVAKSSRSNPAASTSEQSPVPEMDRPSLSRMVSFRQGARGYESTVDVEVWGIAPSKPLVKQGTLTSDGNNGGGESQVLMRFDQIFGANESQIPKHARIKSARLKVVAFDPGTTVYVHRILVPWTEATTWNGLAGGLAIDNVEASTVRDGFTFGQISMDRQSVEFDVTQTVQHWADGEDNFGWVFVNTGSNGWDFYSADWHEKELRPALTVEYEQRKRRDARLASTNHVD